jgi:hypothetical protein
MWPVEDSDEDDDEDEDDEAEEEDEDEDEEMSDDDDDEGKSNPPLASLKQHASHKLTRPHLTPTTTIRRSTSLPRRCHFQTHLLSARIS